MSLPVQKSVRSSVKRHENDLYTTDPEAVRLLLEREKFHGNILEPCAGLGHISEVLNEYGYNVTSSDINDYGYGTPNRDFLTDSFFDEHTQEFDIMTNPPYNLAIDMVQRALSVAKYKVAMLFPYWYITKFYWLPPRRIYLFTRKIDIAKDGDFDTYHNKNMKDYAWFVWEIGYCGDTIIKYIVNNKRVTKQVEKLEEEYSDKSKYWNYSKENMKKEVLKLHAEKLTNREIGRRLNIDEKTVRNWLKENV